MLKLEKFLNIIDPFATNINLTIFEQEKYSSKLSFGITLITTALIAILLQQDLSNMVEQRNPQVLNSQLTGQDPSPYKLEPHNFTYVVFLVTHQLTTLPGMDEYFFPKLSVCNRQRYKDGRVPTINCSDVPLEECSLSKHFKNPVQQKYFKNFNFTGLRCINSQWWSKNNLLLGGTTSSLQMTYLDLHVYPCLNSSKLPGEKACPTQADIDKRLNDAFFFSYISTSVADHSLKGNPYVHDIRPKYTTISQAFTKTFTITYSQAKTQSDVGYISADYEDYNTLILTNSLEVSDKINSQSLMLRQYFSVDDYTQQSRRTYVKLQQIIGSIGGLWSVLFKLFQLIFFPLMTTVMKMNLAVWFTSEIKYSSYQDKKITQKKRTTIQDIKILLLATFGIRNETTETLQDIKRKLDVTYILQSLCEIQKLKNFIFEPEQLKIYDNLFSYEQENTPEELHSNVELSILAQKIKLKNTKTFIDHKLSQKIDQVFDEDTQFKNDKIDNEGQIQLVQCMEDRFLASWRHGQSNLNFGAQKTSKNEVVKYLQT